MNKMIFPMLILFGSIRAEFYLNQNELNIIADVSAELEIRGCIFFHNGSSDKDLNAGFKKLSSMGMFIVLINNESYINHELEWNYRNFSYIKSMVILREDNLLHTNELLSKLTFYTHLEVFKWLVFTNDIIKLPYERFILSRDVAVDINCEFINALPINSTSYKLTEVYMMENQTFLEDFGTWDTDQGLENVDESPLFLRRLNLRGVRFYVAIPAECQSEYEGTKEKTALRVCYVLEIVRDFSTLMNFTIWNYTLEGKSLYDDFTYNYVGKGEILAGGHPLIETFDHPFEFLSMPSYVGPLYKITYNWYIKYPTVKLKSDYYLDPFEKSYWLAVAFSLILGTVVIIIIKMTFKHLSGNKEKSNIVIEHIYVCMEIFCNQGSSYQMKNISFRIVSLSLHIITIFSIASYGAVILSFLYKQSPLPPFKNLDEFFEMKEYRVILDKTTDDDVSNYLISNSEEAQEKWDRLVRDRNFTIFNDIYFYDLTESEVKDHVKSVCDEKLAITFPDNDVYKYDPPCNLYKIDEPLSENYIYLYVRRELFILKTLQKKITRYYGSGIIKRMQSQIYDVFKKTTKEELFNPVEMEQMIQVLSIPLIGIAVSIGIFIFEVFYKLGMNARIPKQAVESLDTKGRYQGKKKKKKK